jgi:LacI family transcriptional regulator
MRRATLADVAREAGVSPSTASRALNGRGDLAPATRAAVVAAAEALGFRPSFVARSLRTRRTQTLGFVVPDIATPFYATVLRAAQEVADRAGYRLVLMNSNQSTEREARALQTLLDHPVDGLLLATAGLRVDEFERLVGDAVPCVFFDGVLEGSGTATVSVHNEAGMRLLVEHLVDHGHRRIALLAGPQAETTGSERFSGFHAAAAALGLSPPSSYVRMCDWTPASGRSETAALLELAEPPTAVVAASDQIALGAVLACRDRAVAIPDDLALVSFDDPQFADLLDPPMTALASQPHEIGARAASLLVGMLRGEPPAQRDVRLPLELIRRRSCGCDA